ncbi:hypothetical protein J6590_012247 [Homalodisca vitripennis]|nr:hypothetical protein J6590_012247 [Homalodisca vitripennis]
MCAEHGPAPNTREWRGVRGDKVSLDTFRPKGVKGKLTMKVGLYPVILECLGRPDLCIMDHTSLASRSGRGRFVSLRGRGRGQLSL